MKRLVSILMIIVLLVLHLAPCTDAFAGTPDFKQQDTICEVTSHGIQHKGHECSPFCSCDCCAVHTVVNFHNNYFLSPIEFLSHQIIDRAAKSKKIALPIWQPPQLV